MAQPALHGGFDWAARAACRSHPHPEIFFDPHRHVADGAYVGPRRKDEARDVCRGCPVRQECLNHAIETKEKFGIRGGLDDSQRAFPAELADLIAALDAEADAA